MDYRILYDNGNTLCFVGNSQNSKSMYAMLEQHRECELQTVEYIVAQDNNWREQRQFIVVSSDVGFKRWAVDQLGEIHYFSMVHQYCSIAPTTHIGHGTYIGGFNSLDVNDIFIGNHCLVGTHNTFGHYCTLGDFSHLGHWSFFSNCTIGSGTVAGLKTFIFGVDNNLVTTADNCNFITDSRVNQPITKPGTYYGTRWLNDETSITKRIL